jgi:membrane protein implicated in regulation of membrane protease activity
MSFLQGLDYHWWWLLIAAVLGILEILVPGIFLVWMALAAGITGLVVALAPMDMPLAWQLGIFALLAFAAVYSGRSVYARNPVASSHPNLNERAARLIGQTVAVETAIENGKGRVTVGDGVWNARGPDLPSGAKVRVIGADGTCLMVEPAA